MNNLIKVKLKTYSKLAFLDVLVQHNLKVYSFIELGNYEYQFECDYYIYKKLKKMYKEIELVEKRSIKMFFLSVLSDKLVLFCLIISIFFFIFISNRIMCIEINGVSSEFNQVICNELIEHNISKYKFLPSSNELKVIEKNILNKYYDQLDIFSLIRKGNYIIINYEKKKEQIIIDDNKSSIYSKKDAVISKILIGSGEVLVKENQYVKQGELLVRDTLFNNDKEIYVGTRGLIYGYTFCKVEINYSSYDDALIEARYLISKDFNYGERIISETIIFDNEEEKLLIIHYKCEEILNSY